MKYIVLVDTDTGEFINHWHEEYDTWDDAVKYAREQRLERRTWFVSVEIVKAKSLGIYHRFGKRVKINTLPTE